MDIILLYLLPNGSVLPEIHCFSLFRVKRDHSSGRQAVTVIFGEAICPDMQILSIHTSAVMTVEIKVSMVCQIDHSIAVCKRLVTMTRRPLQGLHILLIPLNCSGGIAPPHRLC